MSSEHTLMDRETDTQTTHIHTHIYTNTLFPASKISCGYAPSGIINSGRAKSLHKRTTEETLQERQYMINCLKKEYRQ